jgi:hypothetical protein
MCVLRHVSALPKCSRVQAVVDAEMRREAIDEDDALERDASVALGDA